VLHPPGGKAKPVEQQGRKATDPYDNRVNYKRRKIMAQVYLGVGNTNFLAANTNTSIFGQSGTESVFINSSVSGVVVDQNTERVDIQGNASDFTYQQAGNQLRVFSGGAQMVSIPIQGDADGTQIVFSDGSVNALLTLGIMTLGGATVSSTAGSVTPTSINSSITSSGIDSGVNNAQTFLESGDTNYQIANTGTSVFGSSGTESLFIKSGVSSIVTDQNIERVDIDGTVSGFTYQQAGNQLRIFSGGAQIVSIPLQGDADGTQIVFSDGSVDAKLSLGVMTFGGATVSSSAGALTPTTIDTSITAGGGSSTTKIDVSADTGTVETAVSLNATGGAYNYTDDASVLNNVIISNFTSDDSITVSNGSASDYFFSNDGTDVNISYNNAGTLNFISLIGVVSNDVLVYNQSSFETAIGFDAITFV